MSKERELLEKVISGDNKGDFFISYDLYKEIHEFLAKPKREPKFTFDLERMTLALDSPISNVTVEDLMKQVKQAMLELKKLRYASLLENDLRKELEELLAQPEQEPVAWMSKENGDVNKSRSYFKFPEEHQHETIVPLYEREGLTPRQGLEEYKKGYARAELDLKREPLSEQAIWNANTEQLFEEGVRWAEQQHRIIGEDDE